MAPTIIDRFMAKVTKAESGCWIWIGARSSSGYGHANFNGKTIKAHRLAYEFFVGDIPPQIEGMDCRGPCVIHCCDNRLCVNPEHLRIGTHQDNMTDKRVRNRVVSRPRLGERHQNSKLKANDAIDIRYLRAMGATLPQLAREFGVHRATIGRVLDGTTWYHV